MTLSLLLAAAAWLAVGVVPAVGFVRGGGGLKLGGRLGGRLLGRLLLLLLADNFHWTYHNGR